MFDDFRVVSGLKSNDAVLMYGKSVIFGLDKMPFTFAKKGAELSALSNENMMFTRIYITGDVNVSEVGMAKLTAMNAGLISIFLNDQQHQDDLMNYFQNNYPWNECWVVDTNLGKMLMTTAHGAPEWMD